MQKYNVTKLVNVNFECYRICLQFSIFVYKAKEFTTIVHWTASRTEPATLLTVTKFVTTELLRQYYNEEKLDNIIDSLFFPAGLLVVLLFLFICLLSLQSLEGSLQGVFASRIDQKCCCISFFLTKKASTQQKRFMNI